MTFNQNMVMHGTQFFVNFAEEVDPDSGDPFWNQPHSWTLLEFHSDYNFHVTSGNWVFASDSFNIVWDSTGNRALMPFAPNAPTPPATSIALSLEGSRILITHAGTLMQAPALNGPRLPVPNALTPTFSVPGDAPGGDVLPVHRRQPAGDPAHPPSRPWIPAGLGVIRGLIRAPGGRPGRPPPRFTGPTAW